MRNNPVMETIAAAFKLEIANHFTITDNLLTLTLPDHNHIKIQAMLVTTRLNTNHAAHIVPRDHHTFHYIHQHDFTAENHSLEKLLLHNLNECRAYIDDVCITFLNAVMCDGEIQFFDGTKYLITVDAES
ncbi:MAG: hypothetical protein J5598_02080 [Clostridia bacterium]|nr:hypothetical protein [Clostridia bacterium]